MANFIAYLKHGSKKIDLTTAPYVLGAGWSPPGTNKVDSMSSGRMAGKYAGGRKIDEVYLDRPDSVPLNIEGDTAAETHQAVSRLASFLKRAIDDQSEKLYFVYNASDAISYEPIWGQNHRYYEIKSASLALRRLQDYGKALVRNKVIFISLPFTFSPTTHGLRQRVGSATGTIMEHSWATEDNASRGVIISRGIRNYVLNPIFGHSTYNTDWEEGSETDEYENKDHEFILFGDTSAKIVTFGTGNRWYRTPVDVPAEQCTFSVHIKKADGSAVTSADVELVYNSATLNATYQSVGDDWYRVIANATGTGASEQFYIQFGTYRVVYVDGVQVETTNFVTPLIYGDMLDCAWDGTAHTDESTSTAARWRLDADEVDPFIGTICFAWRAPFTSTNIPDDSVFFVLDGTANLVLTWNSGNFFRLSDGTNNADASTGDSTFARDALLIFHAVFGPGGLELYRDGESIASNATYLASDTYTYLYLGSGSAPANHTEGTYSDLTIWRQEFSATEVADHYANNYAHYSGGDGLGQCLNPIPWLWTDDGDDTLDNYYDSTHENYLVFGGIPGNVPAKTKFYLANSASNRAVAISNFISEYYIDLSQFFIDLSGHVDAAAVGGEVEQLTVTITGAGVSPTSNSLDITDSLHIAKLAGLQTHIIISASDGGSDLLLTPELQYGNIAFDDNYRAIGADSTRKVFITYDMHSAEDDTNHNNWMVNGTLSYTVGFDRPSTANTVEIDYYQVMPGDFLYVAPNAVNTREYIIDGKDVLGYDSSQIYSETNKAQGDALDLAPNQLNHLIVMTGTIAQNTVISATVTFNRVYVNPRWEIT